MSPTGIGEPDCMKAARNSPSVLPLLLTICNDAEIAPALSPQLDRGLRPSSAKKATEVKRVSGSHMVTFVGSPPNAPMYFWTHLNASRSSKNMMDFWGRVIKKATHDLEDQDFRPQHP